MGPLRGFNAIAPLASIASFACQEIDSTMAYTTNGIAIVVVLCYTITLLTYRLVFSPLAKFPGPKIAAASGWYEFYHDCWRNGKYIFEIERLHKIYGPIVRINPWELSIHDPEFYKELYVSGSVRRTELYSHFAEGVDLEGSHVLTISHEGHRARRKPLEPYFSRLGIAKLEPLLHEHVERLHDRLNRYKDSGTVLRLDHIFTAFSGDVVHNTCCDDESRFLEDPEFAPHLLAFLIPESVQIRLNPGIKALLDAKNLAIQHIRSTKQKKIYEGDAIDSTARKSLIHHILSSSLPESEKSEERLTKEVQVLLGAGTVTTATTLAFICYYILADQNIRSKLCEELNAFSASTPGKAASWAALETLPFLQAVIKEGLRLSFGIMHRLPRCSPDVPLRYKSFTIPRGTPVGMSAYLMHIVEDVYPEPFSFRPERWLGDIDPRMNRYLVPFARGSRSCLGMNLAMAEINLVIASLFQNDAVGMRMELFNTDESDVEQAHDFMIPMPRLDSKGVRVRIC